MRLQYSFISAPDPPLLQRRSPNTYGQTDYNAAQRGAGRDLVQEYVDASREFEPKVGFYYSLMDWHDHCAEGAMFSGRSP